MVPFLMRAAVTGFALWVVTLFVPGMRFAGGDTTLQRVAIIFVVAVIFGLQRVHQAHRADLVDPVVHPDSRSFPCSR